MWQRDVDDETGARDNVRTDINMIMLICGFTLLEKKYRAQRIVALEAVSLVINTGRLS